MISTTKVDKKKFFKLKMKRIKLKLAQNQTLYRQSILFQKQHSKKDSPPGPEIIVSSSDVLAFGFVALVLG